MDDFSFFNRLSINNALMIRKKENSGVFMSEHKEATRKRRFMVKPRPCRRHATFPPVETPWKPAKAGRTPAKEARRRVPLLTLSSHPCGFYVLTLSIGDKISDIIKLKLFPFSLRGRAKDWLLSLPRNSIDSWVECKDAFIGKYYPPAKIISLRSDIMKFRQFDNEHVA
jgi:hypothetical protein